MIALLPGFYAAARALGLNEVDDCLFPHRRAIREPPPAHIDKLRTSAAMLLDLLNEIGLDAIFGIFLH